MNETLRYRTGATVLALLAAAAAYAPPCKAVTIRFDGAEPGIGNLSTDFSFAGSNWSGGTVRIVLDAMIYHSGTQAYMIPLPFGTGAGQVTLDIPVIDVSFAFMHGGSSGIASASSTAFESNENLIGTVNTVLGAGISTSLTTFSTGTPISRITFDGGVVDTFSFTPLVPGDGNGDGLVNAGDYTRWANGFGTPNPAYTDGDFNVNGVVNAGDYTIWANNFGMMLGADGPHAVPEPSTLVLWMFGIAFVAISGLRRRSRL
jgi:hypothetical protein